MDYTDSFNEHSDALREKREAADRDDYNLATSGLSKNVGRSNKHLPVRDEINPLTGKKKGDIVEALLKQTLEQLLRDNEQYRLNHENLISALHDAAQTTQSVLERVVSELAGVRGSMKELLSSAAKLENNIAVFKDKDGNVRNEVGEIILAELAAQIEWTGNEPTYEEYITLKGRIAELEEAERELRGIETEIGGIRDRATDNENPLAPDEQKPTTDTIKGLEDRARDVEDKVLKKAQDHSPKEIDDGNYENDTDTSKLRAKPTIAISSNP